MSDKKKKASTGFKDRLKQRAEAKRAKRESPVEIRGFVRAVPVIMIAVALFLTLCFITAETGAFGKFISNLLMGLFSYMAYTIPALIVMHAIFFYNDMREHRLGARVIFSVSAIVVLSMIAYIIPNISKELVFNAAEFYTMGTEAVGGGFIGSIFAFALAKIIGKVGLIIVIVLVIALYILYLVSGGGSNLSRFFLKKLGRIANYFADLETRSQEKKKKKNEERLVKQRALDEKKNAALYNDEYFNADNGVATLEIPELGILETKSGSAGAPFLRETVIKNAEDSAPEPEKDNSERKRRFADINLDSNPIFVRTDKPSSDSATGDIVYEAIDITDAKQNTASSAPSGQSENTQIQGTDASADAVFTESFDPFDLAVNERRASKLSSRAVAEGVQPKGFSEYITEMTPEQLEQKRRLEEFERNRQAAIARKAAREAELRAKAEAIRAENERAASGVNAAVNSPVNTKPSEPTAEIATSAAASANTATVSTVNNTEDPAAIAERERQREQARLANILSGDNTPDTPAQMGTAPEFSPASEIKHGTSAPIAHTEHSTPVRVAPTPDRYRFVGATTDEPRRAYSTTDTVVMAQPTRNDTAYTSARFTPAAEGVTKPTAAAADTFATPTATEKYAPVSSDTSSLTVVPDATETQKATEAKKAPEAESIWEDITPANAPEAHINAPSDARAQVFDFETPASEEKTEFTFEEADVESAEEFNFEETDPVEHAEKKAGSEATLEVSRTVLEPTLDYPRYEDSIAEQDSDESYEEDDEEFDDIELEPEEIVEKQEIPEEERNPEIYAQRQMFDVFNSDKNESQDADDDELEDDNSDPDSATDADVDEDYNEDEDEPPFDDYTEDAPVPTPEPAPKPEKKKPAVADYSNYKLPPLDLLRKSPEEDWDSINKEIQYGGEQLINTLDSFNIKATIRGMEHGPRITRYSIVPAKGVRVNQIEKLADDIALALAAESIRIEAPIPGKSAVGVEVPNKVPSLVSLRDLLEAEEFRSETSKTCVCIGKSVEGSLVYGDIGSMPHVLIAGATGMGKSVCINSLITSMLYKARPDEVKFIMIDPKKVEFAPYNGIPHLLVPVVTEPKQAAGALMWAVDEMNKRYDIIEKLCVKSIDSYNKKVAENPELGAPMSKIVIFIDELNDLMVQVRDPVENLIMLIAQKARAAGIHLVIGTQRPSVDVITGVIKANIPSRIACKVSSGIDSRTILEQTGAEKLIGKGDMLFAPSGKAPKRVQGAFVSESETESIVEFIKAQVKGDIYDEQALEDMKRAAQKCDKSKDGGADDDDDDENDGIGYLRDQKFLNAVELAIRNGSVATSFLQRKLKIGYGKAAQYIDIMEDQGIVGEKNGAKAREVLMNMQEWRELLSRRLDD